MQLIHTCTQETHTTRTQAGETHGAYLSNKRQEVVGDALWVLANATRLVGANRIEVAQQHNVPLGLSFGEIAENLLNEKLAWSGERISETAVLDGMIARKKDCHKRRQEGDCAKCHEEKLGPTRPHFTPDAHSATHHGPYNNSAF